MANYLLLNQPQVWNGLGTLSFVIPTTGLYNVQVQTTVPEALAQGSGAGSNKGLGAGTGGGGEGFTGGDLGLGHGGLGQGFGAGNSYQQPPSAGSNQTSGTAVSTGLSVVINDNGSPVYTSTGFTVTQSAQQFKFSSPFTAGHTITVVFASSTASDNGLNGIQSIVSIGQGL